MKRIWKKLSFVLALCCAVIACGIFAACGDNGMTTYHVTVTLEDGTPVEGAGVKLCELDEDGNEFNCTITPSTDADGKASIELETKNYHVTVAIFPAAYKGYESTDVTTGTAGNDITIVISLAEAAE